MNNITLVGRLTGDVTVRYVPGSGTPVASFTMAVDRDFVAKDGKREADFIDIQVWNKQAETCSQYIGKGSMVGVQGNVRIDSYTDNQGIRRKSFRVNANRVQFLTPKNGNNAPSSNAPGFEPQFDPTGILSNDDFAIEDDIEVPF